MPVSSFTRLTVLFLDFFIQTDKDGQHVDVQIAHTKKHGHYNGDIFFNDIAMIYLADDVEFNSMRTSLNLLV